MTNQVVEEKVGIVAGTECVVWRLQKDDFVSVLESTKALIGKEEYEEFFDLAKSDFDIEAVSDYIDSFLGTTGFTDKASEQFAKTVSVYSKLSQTLPEYDPADTIYALKLSKFTEHLLQKYNVTLDEKETAALAALIIEKFSVSEWTEYVATFIDINGYHSPKEDRL
ncbi:hypothetical protein ABD91_20985 [Lysinibacillus sphaericus]|uniref:hypothetical protein n=1 Tax=Lysinibacillus sphaericus TaxID=1421 RepID=UPI0018CE83D0|nr:hypothetical protein [Lysinibacillus sphaericus]MBG9693218.1 hypothetical protein [Lysinibacillus sphaericus]